MKRLLMGLMLVMTATAASAEWTRVGETDEFVKYVDIATIRRNGNLVKMWVLQDFKRLQKEGHFSDISLMEYDCSEERGRFFAYSIYDGKMGGGRSLRTSDGPLRWSQIFPNSIGETQWKIACGKQ